MFAVFDIGGTYMRLVSSYDGKSFHGKPLIVKTPKTFEKGVAAFRALIQEATHNKKIKGVAGGIAGTLTRDHKVLWSSPNLRGWVKKPIAQAFERVVHVPVVIENDAALAGLGESTRGAGRGYKIVMYMTIGTGVGGSRIVEGRIDVHTYNFEPGDQYINVYGKRGNMTLEESIGGNALKQKYHKEPSRMDAKVWEECNMMLAYGIHNAILYWSPEIVVLGGGSVLKTPGITISRVRMYLKKILKTYPHIPQLAKAKLGDYSGLYGALVLLKQRMPKIVR